MTMEILVCVKRVPTVGGVITLTADQRAIDTKASGFTISPHEECAVEEAVRLVERFGGSVTVASLGPVAAEEQLRACLALGATAAVLLETADGVETGPLATATALHAVATAGSFDLVLLGNEASDTGDYQVGIRLAHLLGRRRRPASRRSRSATTARRCRRRAPTGGCLRPSRCRCRAW